MPGVDSRTSVQSASGLVRLLEAGIRDLSLPPPYIPSSVYRNLTDCPTAETETEREDGGARSNAPETRARTHGGKWSIRALAFEITE